ncbi:hypothetical protein HHK36_004256 [Tetracentron sinense]|uniref:DNA repair metallo-beta-lactamase domain-containing protein n=1 Tax=Tetracentron sinense TaxID=13715 RepID=A0A834ZUW7_TETSI|nr:hypothetical protein HHK36_004256 [Tetracentron sinense]
MESFFKEEKTPFSHPRPQRSLHWNLPPLLIPNLLYPHHQDLASSTIPTGLFFFFLPQLFTLNFIIFLFHRYPFQFIFGNWGSLFSLMFLCLSLSKWENRSLLMTRTALSLLKLSMPITAQICSERAVMFLFEGNFGNILHTGDCRLTPECVQSLPEKYIGKKGREPKCRLDYVFLDCTFGRYSLKIPSKYTSLRQVINCIWKHPDAPVVYLVCDLLGQEEILVEVSRSFGSKIFVDKANNAECFQTLLLTAPDILSQDVSLRFQLFEGFPKLYERAEAKLIEARTNFQPEPLIIRPSAQWYACECLDTQNQKKARLTEAERDQFGIWHVCYSMHSSREELEWALQLLQPKRVVSTTPSCRAMELDYVKNNCFGAQVASDDPLWKLLKINMEVGCTSPQASTLAEIPVKGLGCSSVADMPTPMFAESNQLQPNNIPTSPTEILLNLSPPSTRPPITLFGRARLSLQDSTFLQEEKAVSITKHEEKKAVSITKDPLFIISNEMDQEQEENDVEVQFEMSVDNKMVAHKSTSCSRIGPSKCFDESFRKLYRSMNVSVPRPLPSLMELMDVTKRAKRRIQP